MSNPNKRKRSACRSPIINPLSHRPSTLSQFRTAGYPSHLPIPSSIYPSFPHRAIPSSSKLHTDDDEQTSAPVTSDVNTDPDTDTDHSHTVTKPSGTRTAKAYTSRIGPLATTVQRHLSEGDIPAAKRAFGLLQRGMVHGRRVDLRHDRYWEMGVEILMREGDDAQKLDRLERVRTFYEGLVTMYPWDKHHLEKVSALDFFPGLFGTEFEMVFEEWKVGNERVEERWREGTLEDDDESRFESRFDDDGDDDEVYREEDGMGYQMAGEEGGVDDVSLDNKKLRRAKDGLRKRALEKMRVLEEKMDENMETPPFASDHELLRLRGMVALYVADLCVPLEVKSEVERLAGERERDEARSKARSCFRSVQKGGGELEERWIQGLLDEEDDDEVEEQGLLDMYPSTPMYSSLPMR